MRTLAIIILLGACRLEAPGGFERTEGGARVSTLGGAFVGLADDCWAMVYNPAGLSQLRLPEVSAFYSPRPFDLPELRTISVAAGFPTSLGGFGAVIRRFGFELYKEVSVGLGYAGKFDAIHAGFTINYHSVAIANYGSAGAVGIDVGLLVPIMSQLRIGLMSKNLNAPRIGDARERLHQAFAVGVFYQPLGQLGLVFDFYKESQFPAEPRFGFEYKIIDEVILRGGVADQPATYCAGMGIRYAFVQFDYGFSAHQELGMTHNASITLQWGIHAP